MIRARHCGHANIKFPFRGTELTFRFSMKVLKCEVDCMTSSIAAPYLICDSRENITERPFGISHDNSASNTPACYGGNRHLLRNCTTALTLPLVPVLISRQNVTFPCYLAGRRLLGRRDSINSLKVNLGKR